MSETRGNLNVGVGDDGNIYIEDDRHGYVVCYSIEDVHWLYACALPAVIVEKTGHKRAIDAVLEEQAKRLAKLAQAEIDALLTPEGKATIEAAERAFERKVLGCVHPTVNDAGNCGECGYNLTIVVRGDL